MKKIIIKIIGINNYRTLLVLFSRFTSGSHKKIWIGVEKQNHTIVEEKGKNIYFGYYDYPAVQQDKMLYLSTTNDKTKPAEIYYYDLQRQEKKHICDTNTWNYQMGSRLRWISEDTIILNDYKTEKGYISKTVDINGIIKQEYNFPIYDISREKQYSFYTDFSVLNYFRPGYGYTNIEIKIDEKKQSENGIYRGEFETNTFKKILSMDDIISYNSEECKNAKAHYINHIYCCPFDSIIMFFHLWLTQKEELRNRVFIINYNGDVLQVISDFDRASHYNFKNNRELLLTVLKGGKNEYRVYDIQTGKYRLIDFLIEDGHPSYIGGENFITDTYPDHNGMQHIFLCNEKRIICEIAQIYHNPRKNEEYRCDLHPRYGNGILTFDSIIGKYRCENVLKIDLSNTDKLKKMHPKMSYKKKLYLFISHRLDVNIVKYIYTRLFNFSYKAHLLIHKMFRAKTRIMKDIYFNRLQKKYSMWISPECKIGQNVRFMHLDGVTIGSGAIIGDNCTIYHQVTIGKEKEKFPVIGEDVTIYAGAKIIGDVKIGNGAVIGANAVVLQDVPDNCVAVGIPARIIKRKDM